MQKNICPLCGSEKLSNVLYEDKHALITIAQIKSNPENIPTSTIQIKQCYDCGYMFNSAFDIDKTLPVYSSKDYVVKTILPGSMSKNIQSIYQNIEPFIQENSTVLEIGCGQADLALAFGKISKNIVTVDPSVQLHLQNLPSDVNHRHIHDYFNYDNLKSFGNFDVIIFRHLLEHIPSPLPFLEDVSKLISPNGIVYIEVPDAQNMIEHERFYDVFNDHFGYFQQATLDQTMHKLGFIEKKITKVSGGHHMGVFYEKVTTEHYEPKKPILYGTHDLEIFDTNRKKIDSELGKVSSVAIWGAGAHGQSILSSLSEENIRKITYYLDKDGNKQNKFIPNTTARIIQPTTDVLKHMDLVIISAVLYEDEIAKELTNELNYQGKVLKIGRGVSVN